MNQISHLSSTRNVRFYTLGCKVNQYETQAMREAFERKGLRDAEGDRKALCDFVVLNTCTVTEDADKTNRYWIRRLRREHPGAQLVVTGCYVQKNRCDIEAMPEVDRIFPNHEKSFLADALLDGKSKNSASCLKEDAFFPPLSISRSEGRTRAYVKIQDGCNHRCSFCKVALVRGRSRSRLLPEILDEVVRLRDNGYREIILTGIQLGAYGKERGFHSGSRGAYPLLEVIELCAQIPGIERIRLSSIELTDLEAPLRAAFKNIPKLCPHLHIPLQSGDNEVLKRMNRRYTREAYRDIILELRQSIPDFALSMDVMAGFPGETEDQYQNTLKLLEIVQPLKVHVFPYSRRQGTRAAAWDTLPLKVVRHRVKEMIQMADQIAHQVRSKFLGRSYTVLVEECEEHSGLWTGYTANYLKVFFSYPQNIQGCMIPVHLVDFLGYGFQGISVDRRREQWTGCGT